MLPRRQTARRFFFLCLAAWVISGTGCTASPAQTSTTACSLTLSYAGPSGFGTFAGLGEDAARCLMASWREAFANDEPDATIIFVSTACGQGAGGSLANPFCSLADALEKASQLAGEGKTPSLYLDPGSYAVGITLKRELPSLAIRGLCSETTALSEADPDQPIIDADESVHTAISLEGLTLQAGRNALLRITNGTATLAQVQVISPDDNSCFEVAGSQAELTAKFIAIDGGVTANAASPGPTEPTGGVLQTMPVVDGSDIERCIHVHSGGQLVLENFYLHDLSGVGIFVTGAGSRAELTSGVISGIQSNPNDEYGYGMSVEDGATAVLADVTLTDNDGTNFLADGDGTAVAIEGSAVGGALSNSVPQSGVGLIIQNGAQGEIASTLLQDNAKPGLFLSSGSTTTARDLLVTGNGFSGIAVTDAVATILGSAIRANPSDSSIGGGIGVFLQSWTSQADLTVTLSGNVIEQNDIALYAIEQTQGGMTIALEDNLFHDSAVMGAVFLNIPTGITLAGNCFWNSFATGQDSPFSFGRHLVLDEANALLADNTYQGTYDEVTIQQQHCELLPFPPASPYAIPVDISQEHLPTFPDTCLCTGCYTIVLVPTPWYAFDIVEPTAVE